MTEQPGTGQTPGWAAPGGTGAEPNPPQAGGGWGMPTPPPGVPGGPGSPGGPGAPGQPPPGWGTPPPPPPGAGWGQPAWGAGPPPAPKPGIVPLRPLGFGEVLDGAFTAVQRYPKILLGLAALIVTGLMLVTFLVMFLGFADFFTSDDIEQFGGARIVSFALSMLVILVLFWIAQLTLTGMITVTVSQGVLGRPVTVRQVWDTAKGRILSLCGYSLLLGVAVLVAFAVVFAVCAGLIYLTQQAGVIAIGIIVTVLLAIGMAVGSFYVSIRLALAPAALVLETRPVDPGFAGGQQRRLGIIESMRRSWSLVQGRFWRTFGLLFVSSLIAGVIASIIQYGFLFLGVGIAAGVSAATSSEVLGGAISVLLYGIGSVGSTVLQMSFISAVNALIYVDSRMRGEGLDLELASITGGDRAADPAAAHPWAAR
ncbi:hypothetical protein [Flindersiella endophytica]